MWAWDSTKPPYMAEFASNWILLASSAVCAAPMIWLRIKDHVEPEEYLEGTDEKLEAVAPKEVREKTHTP